MEYNWKSVQDLAKTLLGCNGSFAMELRNYNAKSSACLPGATLVKIHQFESGGQVDFDAVAAPS